MEQTYLDAIAERRAHQFTGKPVVAQSPEKGANSVVVEEKPKKKAKKSAKKED